MKAEVRRKEWDKGKEGVRARSSGIDPGSERSETASRAFGFQQDEDSATSLGGLYVAGTGMVEEHDCMSAL
eukprot:1665715-Pleurochrysis_carterae.AAC.1